MRCREMLQGEKQAFEKAAAQVAHAFLSSQVCLVRHQRNDVVTASRLGFSVESLEPFLAFEKKEERKQIK